MMIFKSFTNKIHWFYIIYAICVRICYATTNITKDLNCILKPVDPSEVGAYCDVVQEKVQVGTRLLNCEPYVPTENTNAKDCREIPKGCFLELDLHVFAGYAAFNTESNSCGTSRQTIFNITFNHTQVITDKDINTALFPNLNEINIGSLQFSQVKFEVSPIDFIVRHFKRAQNIIFDNSESDLPIEEGLDRLPLLRSFTAIGGYFHYITRNSFVLAGNFTTVDILRTKLRVKIVEKHSFVLPDTGCRDRAITVSLVDMELPSSVFKGELIDFERLESNCDGVNINLNITVTGQSFSKTIPEHAFRSVITSVSQSKILSANLKFDNIDCCMNDSRWLFELIKGQDTQYSDSLTKGRQSTGRINFDVDCLETGNPIVETRNLTALDEACYDRNVYPILIIAIVSIFLLAVMLSVFSFICIVHILPKRNQEIVMNNQLMSAKTASLFRSSAKSSDILELISTQTSGPQLKKLLKKHQTADSRVHIKRKHRPTSPIMSGGAKSPPHKHGSALKHHKSPNKYSATNLPKAKHRSPSREVRELNLPRNVYSLPGFRNKGHSPGEYKHKSPNKSPKSPKSPKEHHKLDVRTNNSSKSDREQVKPQSPSPIKSPINTVDSAKLGEKNTVKTLESKTLLPGKKITTKSQEITSGSAPILAKKSEKSLGEQMSLAFKTVN